MYGIRLAKISPRWRVKKVNDTDADNGFIHRIDTVLIPA
jgi:uncharacterized surface protein with fasciclin (FAS1) repeats